MAWGCTYSSHIQKVQVKQNHVIRLIFFIKLHGKDTASALPLLNLLDILTVRNVYCLHALKFIHAWHKGMLPCIFNDFFQYSKDVHTYNTRYSSNANLYKPYVRTNSGKQTISFGTVDIWKDLPDLIKNLPVFLFPKQAKIHLLKKQHV